MKELFRVSNLTTVFDTSKGAVKAVDNISFHINEGEILGIVGESGSGKSITALSIMGLVPKPPGRIAAGRVDFSGRDLLKCKESELIKIRGNEISMIFQEPMTSLNPVHSIGQQVDEALLLHRKISKKEARKATIESLKTVGIPRSEQIVNEYPHNLSGGMKQRVMIAMAMACEPKLLIADEPTTALDVTIQAQILDLIKRLQQEKKLSVMLVTHDLGVVAEICQRVVVMYAGQIVEESSVEEIFVNPVHPYTIGLMNCIPNLSQEKEFLETILGQLTNHSELGEGCLFAPRCYKVKSRCFLSSPSLLSLNDNPDHSYRCWHPGKGDK